MADAVDTSGPRPWPGQALAEDIVPGAIIAINRLNPVRMDDDVSTRRVVVVSNVQGILDYFYVITLEQAKRFTRGEIVDQLKLDGLGEKMDLQTMGIAEGTRWLSYVYCTVEGCIK